MSAIREDALAVITEIIEKTDIKNGDIFIVGCSSSEIIGKRMGTSDDEEGREAVDSVYDIIRSHISERGAYLAVQCCEHLNRALVVEEGAMERFGLTQVTVHPVPEAGGSAASKAYELFERPVVVESVTADLGMDIGQTLIGMHLKRVAVPVRLQVKTVGEAILTAARTRPPLIGGERAKYF